MGPHENPNDKYKLDTDETIGDGAVYTLSVMDVTEEDLGVYTCIRAGHPDHVLQETSVSSFGGLASYCCGSQIFQT
ncbi:hypothetical protein E2C01_029682 [Portunus trituberculatus]|uniref:Ig-like domain-containing protein n=1 Tax=Portunus trituberculatus TaxID=210409 RepID=A0A5B7EV78_PORTR|nr:hypothetical protein [Portunus trituberculatus]